MLHELCRLSLCIITNKNFIFKLTISEKTKPDRWAITVMGIIYFLFLFAYFILAFGQLSTSLPFIDNVSFT